MLLAGHAKERRCENPKAGGRMRIMYSGWLLQEGFKEIGCEVIPLRLDVNKTINELVEQIDVHPDVVFIELFGKTNIPKELFNCKYKLAAYCIDSPLNEYWLIPLAKLFDFVYVDQLSSVSKFRGNGVQAKWLPLCSSKLDFRQKTDKKYFISFVGRITPHRIKRRNLINYIKNNFPVNIVQNISRSAMLDIFASSQIVLNENFFSGLNLRFFQALSSGSLLLTERHGYGVNFHFLEGKHYLGYSPDDIISTVKNIERSYGSFNHIALRGQEECNKHHTSVNRAQTVIEDMRSGKLHFEFSVHDKKLHEAQSKYYHAIRFGGNIDEPVKLLKDSANASNEIMSHALCLLGSIHLRLNRNKSGVAYLEKSATVATVQGLSATLKLMIFFAEDCLFFNYLSILISLLRSLKIYSKKYFKYINRLKDRQDILYNSCMLACELLFDLKMNYDLGFHKAYEERCPDYALEYAILAFTTKKSIESLNAIIKCTKKSGIAPEALGYIKSAMLAGAASNEQIALSASLSVEYYDFLCADTAIKYLKMTSS